MAVQGRVRVVYILRRQIRSEIPMYFMPFIYEYFADHNPETDSEEKYEGGDQMAFKKGNST